METTALLRARGMGYVDIKMKRKRLYVLFWSEIGAPKRIIVLLVGTSNPGLLQAPLVSS